MEKEKKQEEKAKDTLVKQAKADARARALIAQASSSMALLD